MVRVNRETYERFIGHSIDYKQSKYHNKKVEYNGMKFDSRKEYAYYTKLKLLEQVGEISALKRQVPFLLLETVKLNDKTYRQTKYIADFTYLDKNGKLHVIDVKGVKTQVYQLKKKLMAWKYGIEIEEI